MEVSWYAARAKRSPDARSIAATIRAPSRSHSSWYSRAAPAETPDSGVNVMRTRPTSWRGPLGAVPGVEFAERTRRGRIAGGWTPAVSRTYRSLNALTWSRTAGPPRADSVWPSAPRCARTSGPVNRANAPAADPAGGRARPTRATSSPTSRSPRCPPGAFVSEYPVTLMPSQPARPRGRQCTSAKAPAPPGSTEPWTYAATTPPTMWSLSRETPTPPRACS